MNDRESLIQALVEKQQIDCKRKRERHRIFGGGKLKPIKAMLDGMTGEERLIFLTFISDEFFTFRDLNGILNGGRGPTNYYSQRKIFLRLWSSRKNHFPENKIQEIETRLFRDMGE